MSNKTFKTSGQKRFGLFSVIALVAGIVIGSGIFQKNDSIVEGVGNQMDAIWAWVAGTVLVLSTVLAFIEVFSISNKAKKPGTLFYWSKNLIGPKTGKTLAIIAVFVYVGMSIAALPIWAANKMFGAAGVGIGAGMTQWEYFLSTWGVGLGFLAVIYGVVIMSKSSQKTISNAGMGIKLVPLIFTIVMGIVIIGMGMDHGISGDPFIDAGTGEAVSGNYGDNSFLNILSVMPAILFTYNGFITSSSIMNEVKSPKTYKAGYLGGMLLVAVIYIMFTVSTFLLGGTGLTEELLGMYMSAEHAAALNAAMQAAIVVSMISGMMGTAASGPKHYANMSADGLFKDENGKLLRRNREMMPQFAAWQLLGIALIYQLLFQGLDMIAIHTGLMPDTAYMMALNFATDFAAIFVFSAYGVIITAALVNRKTKKVEVDKSIVFIPSAIIAIVGIFGVMGFQFYSTIEGLVTDGNWVDFVVLAVLLVTPPTVLYYNERKVKTITAKDLKVKAAAIKAYDNMEIAPEFKEKARPFLIK